MPGVERLSLDLLAASGRGGLTLGIPAMALFPVTPPELKTEEGAKRPTPTT